jgi:hypothetical protein
MTRTTSIAVYHEIEREGLLSRTRFEVYSWLFKHGPATAMEIEVGLASRHVNKRLSELRDQGVVKELGTTICKVTGREVILWDVTDQLPTERIRKATGKTRKQIEEEKDWLFKEVLRLRKLLNKNNIPH